MLEDFAAGRFCGVFAGVGSISFLVPIDEWKPCGDRAPLLGESRKDGGREARSSPKSPDFIVRFLAIVEGGVKVSEVEMTRLTVDGGEEFRDRRLCPDGGGGVWAERSRWEATRVDFRSAYGW